MFFTSKWDRILPENQWNMFYHLLKAVLIDFLELSFQFALKSAVFELEICSLHQNGIEFHQKANGVCFRMEMPAKQAICRQFLFTYAFLLIRTHVGPLCIVLMSGIQRAPMGIF